MNEKRHCLLLLLLILMHINQLVAKGILTPRESETREIKSLDGLWKFILLNSSGPGLASDNDINLMPVPASYNDISTNSKVRDYVGDALYSREFIVPSGWRNDRVWLRFGSVCYSAIVEVNGQTVGSHSIGHLPFTFEITDIVKIGQKNDIKVTVNNILTTTTIPQGSVETLSDGSKKQTYTFDFFNYAGIDRSITLYTTNEVCIDDITIKTSVEDSTAQVEYEIVVDGDSSTSTLTVSVLDKDLNEVAIVENSDLSGSLEINNVNLWWPYTMNDNPGYLYKLRVDIYSGDVLLDRYDQPFGVRSLYWDNDTYTINGEPVYFRGFGRHEDSDIRGKGLDLPLILRDHNLLKWIGANSYRTSHYPYAEEIMDLADELGIMIVDETPAVNIDYFTDEVLENHKQSITELVNRDKNRPSVVMWSVANEPRTGNILAGPYFKSIAEHLKSLDASRPATFAHYVDYTDNYGSEYYDIIGVNRYNGWYEYTGELVEIQPRLIAYLNGWRNKYNKPIFVTEYGADTLEGLHILPNYIWSEEYQDELLSEHFKAFDELRKTGWFFGEMIWNFADFKTDQDITRLGGNKKGVFTRNRQPKSSAFILRKRYWTLANETAKLSYNKLFEVMEYNLHLLLETMLYSTFLFIIVFAFFIILRRILRFWRIRIIYGKRFLT